MEEPYSQHDFEMAVFWAAVLGWAVVTVWTFGLFVWLYPIAAVFGLPIAYVTCWLVGAPVLRRVMRRAVPFPRAAFFGGVIGALVAVVRFVLDRLAGLWVAMDGSFGFSTAAELDGTLTPLGWWIEAQNGVIYTAIGAGIGVAVRWWIGPGKQV
jgi:hypothetical protein